MVITRSRSNSAEPGPPGDDAVSWNRPRGGRKKAQPVLAVQLATQTIQEEEEPRSDGHHQQDVVQNNLSRGQGASFQDQEGMDMLYQDATGFASKALSTAQSLQLAPTLLDASSIGESVGSYAPLSPGICMQASYYTKPPLLTDDVAALGQIMLDNYELCDVDLSTADRFATAARLLQHDLVSQSEVVNKVCGPNFAGNLDDILEDASPTQEMMDAVKTGVDLLICAQVAAQTEYGKLQDGHGSGSSIDSGDYSKYHDDDDDDDDDSDMDSLFDNQDRRNPDLHPDAPQSIQLLTDANIERHLGFAGRTPRLGEPGGYKINTHPSTYPIAPKMHKGWDDLPASAKYPTGYLATYLAERGTHDRIGNIGVSDLRDPQAPPGNGGTSPAAVPNVDAEQQRQNRAPARERSSSGVIRRASSRMIAASHPYQCPATSQRGGRKSLPRMTIDVNARPATKVNHLQLPQQGTPDTAFWRKHGASAATSTPAISPCAQSSAPLESLQTHCGNDLGLNLSLLHQRGSTENNLLHESRKLLSDVAMHGGAFAIIKQQRLAVIMAMDQLKQSMGDFTPVNGLASTSQTPILEVSPANVDPAVEETPVTSANQLLQVSAPNEIVIEDGGVGSAELAPEAPSHPNTSEEAMANQSAAEEVAAPIGPPGPIIRPDEINRIFEQYRHLLPNRYGGEALDTLETQVQSPSRFSHQPDLTSSEPAA